MSFLDNIGKAAQAAAKKSSELVEVTKLNMNVNSEEDKIQKIFNQIGKTVYDKFKTDGSIIPEFTELCESVKVHEDTVASLKQKILEVKNIKSCVNCGAEMEAISQFCVKCGAKQPEAAQAPVFTQAPAGTICPACGASVQTGSAFCTKCGTKIG